jgi:hypothetical protein
VVKVVGGRAGATLGKTFTHGKPQLSWKIFSLGEVIRLASMRCPLCLLGEEWTVWDGQEQAGSEEAAADSRTEGWWLGSRGSSGDGGLWTHSGGMVKKRGHGLRYC